LNGPSAWWLRAWVSLLPGCCRLGERAIRVKDRAAGPAAQRRRRRP